MKKINTHTIAFGMSIFSIGILFSVTTFASTTGDAKNAPTDILLNEIVVNENAANDTFIGTLSAVDPDNEAEDLTFFIPNDAGGRFEIEDGNSLQVKNGNELLNYETDSAHEITILVRDPDWNTFTKNFTILVQNRNESPTDILFDSTAVDEGSESGMTVGTLTPIDPDKGDAHTFALANDAGGRFAIANQNEVIVVDGSLLLAESYDISVYVFDAVGNRYDKYFSVDVNPVQAPIVSDVSVTFNESGDTVFRWTTDKEAKSRIGYGLVGDITALTPFTTTYTTEQEVLIPQLLKCVTHDYRTRSSDDQEKERVGTISTFTTDGCVGNAKALTQKQENIIPNNGGMVQLVTDLGIGIQVTFPERFLEWETPVQVQLKRLEVGAVLKSIGMPLPSKDMYVAGTGLYDLEILQDVSTKISELQKNMTVTFSYSDEDITMLDESTLIPYQWNGKSWEKLPGRCQTDQLNNTITCTTDVPTVFGVFGTLNDIAKTYTGKAKALEQNFLEGKDNSTVPKEDIESLLKKRIEGMKRGTLTKGTLQKKVEEEQAVAQSVTSKLDQTRALFELYKIAEEEVVLCEKREVGACDQIYEYLSKEIEKREKQMIDQLMQNWEE